MKKSFFLFIIINLIGLIPTLYGQQKGKGESLDNLEFWLKDGKNEEVLISCNARLKSLSRESFSIKKSDLLTFKGRALSNLNQLDSAIILHQEALKIRKKLLGKDAASVANSYLNLGNCFYLQKKIKIAKKYFFKSKKIKEQLFPTNSKELIGIYNSLGNLYRLYSDTSNAKHFLYKVLTITKKNETDLNHDIIVAHLSLANLWYDLEFPDSVIFHLGRALEYNSDNLAVRANIFNNLGNAWNQKGYYSKADEEYNLALDLYKKLGYHYDKQSGATLLNMGNNVLDEGDTKSAVFYFENALVYSKKDTLQQAQINNSIGLAYLFKGNIPKARYAFLEAENLYLEVSEHINIAEELGDVYSNFGKSFFKENDLVPTKHYYKKALSIYKNNSGTSSKIAYSFMKLANVSIQEKNLESAENYLSQAETLIGNHQILPLFTLGFYKGKLFEKQNLWQKSDIEYQNALSVLQKVTTNADIFLPEHIEIFTALGRAKLNQKNVKDWKEGLDFIDKAIVVLNRMKGNLNDYESEMDLQNTFHDIFNTGIELCEKLKNHDKYFKNSAFELAESYRGNLLKKLAYKANIQSNLGISQKLVSKDLELQNVLSFYKRRKYKLEKIGVFNEEEMVEVDSLITEVIRKQRNLKLEIQQKYPRYFELLYDYPKISIEDIQKKISLDQSLVLYQWGKQKLWTYVIKKDTFFIQTASNTLALNQLLAEVTGLFQYQLGMLPTERKTFISEKFISLSHELYKKLIEPIEPHLTEKLIIIPDGLIHYLPFELLISELPDTNRYFRNHKFLLHKYAIHYQYASSLLFSKKEKKNGNLKKILSIAPRFNNSTLGLESLDYNEREVELIYDLLGGTVWKGGADSKKDFVEIAEEYQILHLSTHGVLEEENTEQSYLAFSEKKESNEKEQLFVSEVYNLPLQNSEMITLSACQTANGKLYQGEGLLSLSHAFSFAGAKSLVASFWNVNDSYAPAFMHDFYKNLKEGLSKSEALQKAKIDYLNSKISHEEAYPYYWAGFMVIGDDKPIDDVLNDDHNYYWLIGIMCFVIIIFIYRRFNSIF